MSVVKKSSNIGSQSVLKLTVCGGVLRKNNLLGKITKDNSIICCCGKFSDKMFMKTSMFKRCNKILVIKEKYLPPVKRQLFRQQAHYRVGTSKISTHLLARRSKCKPAASLLTQLQSCIQKVQIIHSTDQTTVNQTRKTETIGKSLIERELIEQIGNIEILFLQEEENNQVHQTPVFLPESSTTNSFPNLAQSTTTALSELTIENSTSISEQLHAQEEVLELSTPEELLHWPDLVAPTQTQIRQGELNTPDIFDQLEGFNFDTQISTTSIISNDIKDLTIIKDQFNKSKEEVKEKEVNNSEQALEFNSFAHFKIVNENKQAKEEEEEEESKTKQLTSYYNSINELLDEQMFRLDQDSQVFDICSGGFNNNFELGFNDKVEGEILSIPVLSDDYIPAIENIAMFDFGDEMMEKTNNIEEELVVTTIVPEEPITITHSGAKLKQQQQHHPQLRLQIPMIAVPQKQQQKQSQPQPQQKQPTETQHTVKMEEDSFDLVDFIDSNEFTELTPFEEKQCPNFVPEAKITVIEIKKEEEPSISTASSRKTSVVAESDHQYGELLRPKRAIKKRRYSSDSDFSVGTSASSYNSTRQKIHKRRRGRPAKELITVLPTIEDFKDLPAETASHLVLRIKNNEASRKSRMKSKNQQDALEDECARLERRQNLLKSTKDRLDGQIEMLRKWLLSGI
ncbi:hypothetical protein PVAND_009264 [Polypedilum vanderplanki]|uniref:BZIP domain-containing protein n=1 Tax=Polypedilum vanderplanki TaxID=319348 RepID=A0A9J6CC67_POLVA|nr:hypothetical protein PVAND_009264 [Polypedilum vanderplanki]